MIKFYDAMGPSQGIAALSDVVDALDFWQDGATVKAGEVVRSSTNSMIYAVAQTAGVTGTVEPVWGSTADVTITDNTVTWLIKDIRTADAAKSAAKWTAPIKINGIDVDGSHDITLPTDTVDTASYIGSGLKVNGFDGLNLNISSGRAKIAGNGISFAGGKLALNPRKASLMYLDSAGTLGKVDCANPLDFVDDNTVGMWIFNQTVAGANVPNSAVGKSAIAVANDLVPHGGIASVDGWFDNALQTDATTGYFLGSNLTNFPVATAERELNILLTVNYINTATISVPIQYGTAGTNTAYGIYINTDGMVYLYGWLNDPSTGFVVENGKTYLLSIGFDGKKGYLKVNGVLVYQAVWSINTGAATSLSIGRRLDGNQYSGITCHYVELRNKMRSTDKTAVISNKLILPCFYDKVGAIVPDVKENYASIYHEYRFNETSDTIVNDSNTVSPMTGTVVGTTAIPSEIGLVNARRFNGAGDKISVGNFSFGSSFSFVGVINIPAIGAYAFLSNRNTAATIGNLIYIDTNGYLYIYVKSSAFKILNTPFPTNSPIFIAITVNGNKATVYTGRGQRITSTTTMLPIALDGTPSPLYFGADCGETQCLFNGTMNYMMLGNFELLPSEVNNYYSSLMVKSRRNIIDDIIPAKSVSLGFLLTASSKVLEYNDTDYKYGRREGLTGGNRKVFLGWKYITTTTTLKWDNPFGTGRVRREYHWAQDTQGTNEIPLVSFYQSGTTGLGGFPVGDAVGVNDAQNICAYVAAQATLLNGSWVGAGGYIGAYVEVMEEYRGVDAV